jgi:hypothetical protein
MIGDGIGFASLMRLQLRADLLSHSGERNVGFERLKASPSGSQRQEPRQVQTMNRLLSGSRKSPDRYGLSASNPVHRIAEFIDERVNPKLLLEQISPGLTWGLGVWVLTKKSKYAR